MLRGVTSEDARKGDDEAYPSVDDLTMCWWAMRRRSGASRGATVAVTVMPITQPEFAPGLHAADIQRRFPLLQTAP